MRKTNPGFRKWLVQQRDRDDAIGDLARDLKDDDCAKGLRSVRSIAKHIEAEHGSSILGPVLSTLEMAWEEYNTA